MNTLKHKETLYGHSNIIWCVRWSHSGKFLASCGKDKSIRIWNYNPLKLKWECNYIIKDCHTKTIRYLSWSPCDNFLATAGFDSLILIWQLSDHLEAKEELEAHNYEVKSVEWSKSGLYLGSCARDKSVLVFNVEDKFEIMNIPIDIHTEDVKSVCWHPNFDVLVSCGFDNRICVIKQELDEWEVASTLIGHEHIVRRVEFNRTGTILASASDDLSIKLWTNTDGNEFCKWICATTLSGYHTASIWDISWLPAPQTDSTSSELGRIDDILASCGRDNQLFVFSIQLGSQDNSIVPMVEMIANEKEAHEEDINSVAWQVPVPGSDVLTLATCSDDCSIKLWTLTNDDMPLD